MKTIILAAAVMLSVGCSGGHFLGDESYRAQVHEDFLERRELAKGRDSALFSVLDRRLNNERREAMEFLYAYMPLCDLAEYDGAFFLRQVDGALRARDHFEWNVPEDIFRHFVLVHRVNNEYLDEARDIFFEELKPRLEGLSMKDAALEVNHWCHEKVTYRGSDARTSASLATVRTSWGRCGEQSTFAVAALRSVGIPARQVYTPRWVHTDSNHAWVEVWIDGEWHYMGACEPEPELDVAWFDGPVQRAMMLHTTVYGRYEGTEEKNVDTPLYSVINVLENYAPTRRAEVMVVDAEGIPQEDLEVEFKVYNAGEFYNIATARTDAGGQAGITTGKGDVLVWVTDGTHYGYAKSTAGDGEVTIKLVNTEGSEYREELVMLAPPEQPFRSLPEDLIAANAVRLAREDSIRNAYMATFAPADASPWLVAAQGNWREIEKFLTEAGSDELLRMVSQKDLRDTSCETLMDFQAMPVSEGGVRGSNDSAGVVGGISQNKIVAPRIGLELLTPWRGYFATQSLPSTGAEMVKYVAERVAIKDADNYYDCRLTPRGVHELRVADAKSRDIYFVALCRAAGITARLDPATERPQYMADNQWINAQFDVAKGMQASNVELTLTGASSNLVTPQYGTHYTIAVFERGDFQTLELYGTRLPARLTLVPGYYRIMASSRANDGSATIAMQYLNIGAKGATAEIKLPELEGKLFVKGVVDMNSIIYTESGEKTTLKALSQGKGALLVFADPDREPTKHILQDMPSVRAELEEWGGAVVYAVPSDKLSKAFDKGLFPAQPAQTVWAVDTDRLLLNSALSALQLELGNNFPLALYLTNNGGILFASTGYRIAIPEDILKTIRQEQKTKL